MRVLYVLKRYPRLSETFVAREIVEVEALGVEVAIDALLPPEPGPRHPVVDRVRAEVRYLPRHPRRSDVRRPLARLLRRRPGAALTLALALVRAAAASRRRGESARRGVRRVWQAVLVADRLLAERIDHVHAHFATAAAEVAVPAARMAGVPVTVTAHAKDVFHRDNVAELPRRLRGASAVVTVSRHNAEHLRDRLSLPVRHVPNGVALGPVSRAAGQGADVLCVARLVPKKGIDVLLRALAQVPDAHLEIVGDGPLREPLGALADELGLGERVTWRGALPAPEVERCYDRAAMVVLPCRVDPDGDRDGLPTVLVEALGRGIPVVSTDVVGIPELVWDGQTGVLVPPEDPAAVADAVRRLSREPDTARSLGRCGRQLVEAEYDPEQCARALRRVWWEVA